MSKNTGFDAFFQALTSSPEFKTVMTHDYKGSLDKSIDSLKNSTNNIKDSLKQKHQDLKKSQDEITQASDMMESFNEMFASQEAIDAGEKYSTSNETKSQGEQKLEIIYPENNHPETFGFLGVAGMDDLKKELEESFIAPLKFKFFIEKLKNNTESEIDEDKKKVYLELYERYEKFGVTIPTGVMFYGPPGTGKTFITKKLAQELNCGIIIKSVGEFGSSYIHQTSKNIRDFFSQAKQAAQNEPIILFLDEIDSLVSKRTDKVDSNKAEEISQFLQEINDLKNAQNLILIGATNRPDHLDSAIMRSGRFDKKIYIGAPDERARKELFKIFIEKLNKPHSTLDYDQLAKLTDGYVSADIEAICAEASRDASKSILDVMMSIQSGEEHNFDEVSKNLEKNVINMELLIQAINETPSSLKMVDMSVYDEWIASLN